MQPTARTRTKFQAYNRRAKRSAVESRTSDPQFEGKRAQQVFAPAARTKPESSVLSAMSGRACAKRECVPFIRNWQFVSIEFHGHQLSPTPVFSTLQQTGQRFDGLNLMPLLAAEARIGEHGEFCLQLH
jgi:hypothetical protein